MVERDLFDQGDSNFRAALRRLFCKKAPALRRTDNLLKMNGAGAPELVDRKIRRKKMVLVLPRRGGARRRCKEKSRKKEDDGANPIASVSALGHCSLV